MATGPPDLRSMPYAKLVSAWRSDWVLDIDAGDGGA